MLKRIVSILLVLIIPAVFFTGCKKKLGVEYKYDKNYKIKTLATQVVAENDNLKLTWSDEVKCILLEDKTTGKIWSTVPYDLYEKGEFASTLDLSIQNMELYQWESASSQELFENGKISCEKIKNGVKLTYYFDKIEISVPVCYTLREDSLNVAITGSEIQESGKKYRLVYVSPTPKLCSVSQEAENCYIFFPEGNGAIIKTTSDVDGHRKVSIGTANAASHNVDATTNAAESCGMRVFGLKNDKDAIVGIAEDTPGAVGVYATAGERTSDYSSVYPMFNFVDTDYFYGKASNSGAVRHLSDRYQSKVSVSYYPLDRENADYNGMAKRYRKYLMDNGYIAEDTKPTNSPYSVTLLGGVMTTTSISGVPTKTLKSMTDYSQAEKIIKELTDATGIKPVVRMKGYTKTGINIGEIAGGYSFASKIGSDKERKAFEKYCKDNNISVYFEFDLIKYSESGSGFSYSGDSAKTAILYPAEKNGVNVPLRDSNADVAYRLLKRSELGKAVEKLAKMAEDKEISGIGIATLGQISYSDYSEDIKYGVTGGMHTDTKKYVNQLKKSADRISGSASTYFAAGLMDTVFDAPLGISGMYQYEAEIPFYQLVYSGVTPLYSSAINTASLPERKIMMAASTGTGLGFTFINDYDRTYMETRAEKLYACVYKENADMLKDAIERYAEIYKAIDNSKIDRYELLEHNISKTVFENGVVVYANNSSIAADSPVGELEGYGFRMEREG